MNRPVEPDVTLRLESPPKDKYDRLANIGLLNARSAALGKLLSEHRDDFMHSLQNNGRSADCWKPVKSRTTAITNGSGFRSIFDISRSICDISRSICDISLSAVEAYLAKRKSAGLCQRPVNYLLAAVDTL